MNEQAKNALHSLYGEGHVAATRTRECVAMPGVRDQVVRSPQGIVDGLLKLWPGGVVFDPAHAEGSIINAGSYTSTRGLLVSWPDRTYCNPPFGKSLRDPDRQLDLLIEEDRIRKVAKAEGKAPKWPKGLPVPKAGLWDWQKHQLTKSAGESVLLCPNRTNRKWHRKWRDEVDGLVELDPLPFLDEKQAYPAPIGAWICRPKESYRGVLGCVQASW